MENFGGLHYKPHRRLIGSLLFRRIVAADLVNALHQWLEVACVTMFVAPELSPDPINSAHHYFRHDRNNCFHRGKWYHASVCGLT